ASLVAPSKNLDTISARFLYGTERTWGSGGTWWRCGTRCDRRRDRSRRGQERGRGQSRSRRSGSGSRVDDDCHCENHRFAERTAVIGLSVEDSATGESALLVANANIG